jgi:hypothetical protein
MVSKIEDLILVKKGIEMNRHEIELAARRLDLQHVMLEKLLGQMRDILVGFQTYEEEEEAPRVDGSS